MFTALLLIINRVTAEESEPCWKKLQASNITEGWRDSSGNRVDRTLATAVSFEVCVQVCGKGSDPFRWTAFAPHFTASLLPWLALATQIPSDSLELGHALLAVILTIGSPVLAGYALTLTVLNNRWVDQHFLVIGHRQVNQIIETINSSPQFPLQLVEDTAGGAHRIRVRPNNFRALTFVWSIVAFCLTVSIYLTNETADIDLMGQGVSTLWLWMLPITIGWAFLSTRSDRDPFQLEIIHVNTVSPATDTAQVTDGSHAAEDPDAAGARNAAEGSHADGIAPVPDDSHLHGPSTRMLRPDKETCTTFLERCHQPVCNFARIFLCVEAFDTLLSDLGSGEGAKAGKAVSLEPF